MKNLYIENYKTILKETKDRNTVEKKICVHGFDDKILLSCQNSLKLSTY